MKRVDREIAHMPQDDRNALFAIARDRTEQEINRVVGEDAGFVKQQNSVQASKEFFLSLPEIHTCLYRIHCRQVWREMQRAETQYGETGTVF
jgi:hypothetical protein